MIIPGILEQTLEDIKKKIRAIDGISESIQIDVADNKQVEGLSFLEVEKLREIDHKTPLEIHFMVEAPLDYLALEKGKIPSVSKVCTQVTENIENVIEKLKSANYEVGVSLNPEEGIELIAPLIAQMDYVQFMSVVPGKQGNSLIPEVLDKIREFKQRYPNVLTQIDGGVDEGTLPQVLDSGVDNMVVGSAIFNSGDPKEKLLEFQRTAHGRTNNT